MYKVRHTSGQLCDCDTSAKNRTLTKFCDNLLSLLNFTVEISVERIRNQWGENCSFTFFRSAGDDDDINIDLTILPGNISTTTQPSLTTSEVLSNSTTLSSVTADDQEEEKEELPTGTMSVCVLFSVQKENENLALSRLNQIPCQTN